MSISKQAKPPCGATNAGSGLVPIALLVAITALVVVIVLSMGGAFGRPQNKACLFDSASGVQCVYIIQVTPTLAK